MDARIVQMCQNTGGVRIHMSGPTGWRVETLEENDDGSPSESVREWGASAFSLPEAISYCYGAFLGLTDRKVDVVRRKG